MSADQGSRFRTWSDGLGGEQLRIGDVEREAAVTALGEHYASGRLSKEEYDERATVAYEARSLAALQPLFADLPLPHGPLQPATPTYTAGPGGSPSGPSRPRGGFPWFPILVVLIIASAITHLPLFLIAIGGWIFWASRRRHGWGHTNGSCVGGRGSWR